MELRCRVAFGGHGVSVVLVVPRSSAAMASVSVIF
jgi:hypothetical protein